MLVDSHCHIHLLPDFPDCATTAIKAAHENDVNILLNVAVSLDEMPTLHKLAEHDSVYISAGIHPNEKPGEIFDTETILTAVNANKKIIAVGETGLDYYRQDKDEDLSWQQNRFVNHIDVAREVNKPLIIHSRAAKKDTIALLRDNNASDPCGVMHCFTEDWEMAKQAMDLGFYVSFSGIVTFKNATELQDVAKKMPADRILIETDCPYLAPVPYRGKTNQPAYVKHIAEFLSELRGEDYEQFAEQTTQNFKDLFF